MHVLNIIPYQGIAFESGKQIFFNMSLAEFDLEFPDFQKRRRWNIDIRENNFFRIDFDSQSQIDFISFASFSVLVTHFAFSFNGRIIHETADLLNLLLACDHDIREDHDHQTLYFFESGICLSGFHQATESPFVEIFKRNYYDDPADFSHPYPETPCPKHYSREFMIIPHRGLDNKDLGEIKLGDSQRALRTRWEPYFYDYELQPSPRVWNVKGLLSLDFGETDYCQAIAINTEFFHLNYCGIVVAHEKNWRDKLKAMKPNAFGLQNDTILFFPEDCIVISADAPHLLHILSTEEYGIFEKWCNKWS